MIWAERAAAAERSVVGRHLRRIWPWGWLAASKYPAPSSCPWPQPFNYWWQAHFLDCLVDAELRAPAPQRRRIIRAWPRAQWARNGGRWINDYFDDVAWLGLALERSGKLGLGNQRGLQVIVEQLRDGWVDDDLGGLRWRRGDDFRNAPANAPAALLFARTGYRGLAYRGVRWLEQRLRRGDGLLFDGIRPTGVEEQIYTYCQGLYLGALLELGEHDEATRVAEAIRDELTTDGVLVGAGTGDGGLFAGITARYLALAGQRDIVLTSAEAAWEHRTVTHEGVFFGTDWSEPAGEPSKDLSVQLSGWMLLEAAATLE